MNKTTKGAIATGAAAVLMMGGAGTLAFWTETVDVPGGTLESGHLEITGDTCTAGPGAAPWELDGGADVTAATRIVPGDTVTKTCSFTIDGEGDHFENVDLDITSVTWGGANDLTTAIGTPTATFTGATDGPIADGDVISVDQLVTVEITATFPTTVTGDDAEDLVAALNAVSVTATQNHTP